jgi:hypothetical protein
MAREEGSVETFSYFSTNRALERGPADEDLVLGKKNGSGGVRATRGKGHGKAENKGLGRSQNTHIVLIF